MRWIIGLFLMASLFGIISPGASDPMLDEKVTVIATEGETYYMPTPEEGEQPLQVDMELNILAQVRTGADGQAELKHDSGVIRVAGPNSRVAIYQIVKDCKVLQDKEWIGTVWQDICRILDQHNELLTKVDRVKEPKGDYRVDWESYNFASLHWKDKEPDLQSPTIFHILSVIAALEKMMDDAESIQKPELLYLRADCHHIVGNESEAQHLYKQVVADFPESDWSEKAKLKIR